jgi:hypothetical protein
LKFILKIDIHHTVLDQNQNSKNVSEKVFSLFLAVSSVIGFCA